MRAIQTRRRKGGDLKEEHSKTEKEASSKVPKMSRIGIKRKKLCGGYGSVSRSSKKRLKKSARELKKEGSKSYDIRAL